MYKALKQFRQKIVILIWYLFRIIPVNKYKIVINQFNGLGYGDNPKYICEELLKNNLKYKIVWLVKDNNQVLPDGIKRVKIRTISSIYHLVTAKVWISNVRLPFYAIKRRKQYYIQTWHGGLGLKKVEKDAEQFLDKEYIENAKRDSKLADLFISNCSYRTNMYRNSFWYDGEIMEKGTPRNDFLINNINNEPYKVRIKRNLNIDSKVKIILYAPTYRQDNSMEFYKFSYERLIDNANKKFNTNFVMLIRLHPNIAYKSDFIKYNSRVIDVSSYDDMQELLLITDILITDYSSCMFDFALTKKLVLLYSLDYDKYISNRGLNIDYFKLPFKIATTNNELINNLRRYNEIEYRNEVENFLSDFGMKEMGIASKSIINKIGEWQNEKI